MPGSPDCRCPATQNDVPLVAYNPQADEQQYEHAVGERRVLRARSSAICPRRRRSAQSPVASQAQKLKERQQEPLSGGSRRSGGASRHCAVSQVRARARLRAMAEHQAPEARAVIQVLEMRDFMRGDIVEHEGRREDQPPGIGQGCHPPSTSPSGSSGRAPTAAECDAHRERMALRCGGEVAPRLAPSASRGTRRARWAGSPATSMRPRSVVEPDRAARAPASCASINDAARAAEWPLPRQTGPFAALRRETLGDPVLRAPRESRAPRRGLARGGSVIDDAVFATRQADDEAAGAPVAPEGNGEPAGPSISIEAALDRGAGLITEELQQGARRQAIGANELDDTRYDLGAETRAVEHAVMADAASGDNGASCRPGWRCRDRCAASVCPTPEISSRSPSTVISAVFVMAAGSTCSPRWVNVPQRQFVIDEDLLDRLQIELGGEIHDREILVVEVDVLARPNRRRPRPDARTARDEHRRGDRNSSA